MDYRALLKDAQFQIFEKELIKKARLRAKSPMAEEEYLLYLRAYLDRAFEVCWPKGPAISDLQEVPQRVQGSIPSAQPNPVVVSRVVPPEEFPPTAPLVAEGQITDKEREFYRAQDEAARAGKSNAMDETCKIIIDSFRQRGWGADGTFACQLRADRPTTELRQELGKRGLQVADLHTEPIIRGGKVLGLKVVLQG